MADKQEKCLIWVDAKKYDLTLFASSHPGGKYVLNEFNNKDGTLFYHSTHKLKSIHKVFTPIAYDTINPLNEMNIVYAFSTQYVQLTNDVYELLNNDGYAPILWHIRAWILMISQCFFWYSSIFLVDSMSMIIVYRVLYGLVLPLTSLNVAHDALHGSVSRRVWINRMYAYISSDLLSGESSQCWRFKHNYSHHIYSNSLMDHDFDTLPLIATKFHHQYFRDEIRWFHRFQLFYLFALFQFYPIKENFLPFYSLLYRKKVWSHSIPKAAQFESKINIMLKIIFVVYYYIMSFYVYNTRNGFNWLTSILLIHISHIVYGTYLGLFFVLSHNFIGSQVNYNENENKIMKLDWAKSQIESASNHSGNICALLFCGSLNYQIEHHLFPRINSIHYPKLLDLVSHFAKKHKIKYTHFRTIYGNLSSTIKWLNPKKWD